MVPCGGRARAWLSGRTPPVAASEAPVGAGSLRRLAGTRISRIASQKSQKNKRLLPRYHFKKDQF